MAEYQWLRDNANKAAHTNETRSDHLGTPLQVLALLSCYSFLFCWYNHVFILSVFGFLTALFFCKVAYQARMWSSEHGDEKIEAVPSLSKNKLNPSTQSVFI